LKISGRLERQHRPETAIAQPATIDDDRRIVQWKRTARAEDVDQRSAGRARPKQEQLSGVEINGSHRKWRRQIVKASGRYHGLDRGAQRGWLEQRSEIQACYRSQWVANHSTRAHHCHLFQQLVIAYSGRETGGNHCPH
jgi:hypothetical protein